MISNFFGEVWIFGLALLVFFVICCLSLGINFAGSLVLALPITVAIASSGFLSGYSWISDVILVIVGLSYGFILFRLLNK